MATNYTKFDVWMDAIDLRARELAIAKINAERTSREHVAFWEEVMETEDFRIGSIIEMAVCDGESKPVMLQIAEHFTAKWDKILRDTSRHEVLS